MQNNNEKGLGLVNIESPKPFFRKKNFIIIALVSFVFLILLIAILYFISQKIDEFRTVAPKSVADCEYASNDIRRSWCLHKLAVSKNDFSICEKISRSDATGKSNCYGSKAVFTKDVSVCEAAPMVWICVSAMVSNLPSNNASDIADCNLFMNPPETLLAVLRKQDSDSSGVRNKNNFSSIFDGVDLLSIKEDWRQSCLESFERHKKYRSSI